MKKFIKNLLALLLIFVLLIVLWLIISNKVVKSRNFKNYSTESILLTLNSNEQYDVAIMGISHARIFSRDKNHLRVEKILNKKVLNISRTGASCGVNEQMFYLSYLYSENVKIDTIVYFASPSLIFGEHLNKFTNTFEIEPFNTKFFLHNLAFKSEEKYERLFNYFKSKFSWYWIRSKPEYEEANLNKLTKMDSLTVKRGLELTYSFGDTYEGFKRNCNLVEETVKLAQKNGSVIIFVIPSALFGKWPGHADILEFLKVMEKKYAVKYYDFSESVLDPQYYYDSHHLNSFGVVFFTNKFLKPIFNSELINEFR